MNRSPLLALVIFAIAQPVSAGTRIERVSVSSDGAQANGASVWSAVSPDGRLVAFSSLASNLVAGDTNEAPDVFLRDPAAGSTRRISVASDGTQADGGSDAPVFSPDGRWVGFVSAASNLVPDDTNDVVDVFVHDLVTGETERVSLGPGGAQLDGHSGFMLGFDLSAGARHIAFATLATSHGVPDANGTFDVVVRDRVTGEVETVSLGPVGATGEGPSGFPAISPDGRWLAFSSSASDVGGGTTRRCVNMLGEHDCWDVFRHDRQTGRVRLVSAGLDGLGGDGESGFGITTGSAISDDGQLIAYMSSASNLVPDDRNPSLDVFVADLGTGVTELVSVSTEGEPGSGWHYSPSMSPDGRWVAFSAEGPLTPGDVNRIDDVYLRDRVTGRTTWVSRGASAVPPVGTSLFGSLFPSVSDDARVVSFGSTAHTMVLGDTNLEADVFAWRS